MFIYNVTTKITWQIHEAWLQWLQEIHAPEIIATGCFIKFQALRLQETDETEGPTYIFQYHAESKAQYNRYIELHAARFRQDVITKWGDQFIAFRTLMEVIN